MKSIFNKLFIGVLFLSLATSCKMYYKAVPVAPLDARVNFTTADLEYLGEIKGSATQSYLLGFIPVGGRRFYYSSPGLNPTGIFNFSLRGRGFNNAYYDALQSKPEADFVLPLGFTQEVDRMFLGRKVTIHVKAKAFKLKEK